ncbi:MAG: thiol-disulfide oxidoreductase DCC family protein [Myxococcales bacterium]|nr:thiol-disulfide oxidoreductase DCC family protein [Myxococcales bacterium]
MGSRIEHPVVLFDGVCNLCNATVQWLIDKDGEGRFRFASLQSEAARDVLAEAGVRDPSVLPDSIVLVDAAGVHVRSTAALRIGAVLGFPYNLGKVALLVPRPLRDAVYNIVARNRYRWFGRRDVCMRPTPELAARFLDAGEEPPS